MTKKKKERELPVAYPPYRYRQAPQQWISTEKPTPQAERELTATCSHCCLKLAVS